MLAYFFALSYRGLWAYFSGDDLVNIQFLHGFGQRPWWMLLVNALVVATPEYRPAGGIIYRALFAMFGLEPLGFRVFCYGLMVFNLSVIGMLFYRLTHSTRIAFLGVLLFAFHPAMAQLYFNTGTLYDMLCFTFGFAALIVYVTVRNSGRFVERRSLATFLVLFCLALDSKEMAAVWPLVLMIYEVVYHPNRRDLRRRWGPVVLTLLVAAIYIVVKTQVPNPMSINVLYHPHLSWRFIAEDFGWYYSLLLFNRTVQLPALLIGLAALVGMALAMRNRAMCFGAGLALVTLLPVAVIDRRAGFVWYIPFAGWALYLASGAGALRDAVRGKALTGNALSYRFVAGLAVFAAGLFLLMNGAASSMGVDFAVEQNALRSILTAQKRELPRLEPGSRILIVHDGFSPVNWFPLFLMRLAYRDATIWVDRVSQMGSAFDAGDTSVYREVIDASRDPVTVLPAKRMPGLQTIRILPEPSMLNRGLTAHIAFPEFRNCSVDVEYRMPDDELNRSGIWKNWCQLGVDGAGTIRIDPDAERGLVVFQKVRFCHGDWKPANGALTVLP